MSDDLTNDLTGTAGEPQYLFDAGRGCFWKQQGEEWIDFREAALRRDLMKRGHSHKIDPAKAKISPLDDEIRAIEQERRVKRAIEVAGYRAGVVQMGPDRILVPRSAPLVREQEGEWRLTAAFLEGLLVGRDAHHDGDREVVLHYDQRDHFFTYLQHWLESLYAGEPTSGICWHLAGEPECGKTRVATWLKELSGGRVGKPYRFMIGRDDFNLELFEASLQLVDDEQADTSREARKEFAGQLKQFVANEDLKLRGMHANGFNLRACWRLVVLTNLEEAALLVFPAITGDIEGKVLQHKGYTRPRVPSDPEALKAYRAEHPALAAWWDHALATGVLKEADLVNCHPMPMPAANPAQQGAFWRQMRAELPAFVFWLRQKYAPPSSVTLGGREVPCAGGRFGVRHWQHPEILEALQEFSAHVRLWQLIDRSKVVFRRMVPGSSEETGVHWEDTTEWRGTARELEQLLKSEASMLTQQEKNKEVSGESWIGQRLKEAMRHWGIDVAEFKRTGKSRLWTLRKRPDITG